MVGSDGRFRRGGVRRELLYDTLSLEPAQVLGAHAWVNAVTCQKQLPNVVTAALIVLIDVFVDQKWPDVDAHAALAHQQRVPGAVS
jgi:hypothetical protein